MHRIIAFYVAIFAILSISHSTSVENVPVFLWGSDGSAYSPALRVYTPQEFKDLVHSQQTEKTVTFVFYENNLATEDISHCKRDDGSTCFENLQAVSPKTYLSSVENPLKTLRDAAQYKKHANSHLNTDGSFSDVDVTAGSYIFISLSDNQENEKKSSALSRHDSAIKNFVNKYSDKYDVLAIYTGKHASIPHHHKVNKRQAPAQAEPTPSYYNLMDGKVLIYFTELKQLDSNKLWQDLTVSGISIPTQNESDYNVVVDIGTGGTDKLTFTIKSKYGNWYMVDPVYNNVAFKFNEQVLGVTRGFSYHCSPGLIIKSTVAENRLAWHGLQIEAVFGEDKLTKFSEPWDCVGYMSPAIWSGIFVIFILLFIIFIGFSWVYDIKTMDRFDDPKGKTITVTEQD